MKNKNPLPLERAPESICLLRLSALGDVTHALPVARAIQRHWPQTRLTWIIGPLEHRLLGDIGDIEFIVFDKQGGWRAIRDLRRRLRGRRFDVLLHMQTAARANLLSRLIKANIRLGWDRARSRDQHHWFVNQTIPAAEKQHQVDACLSFATRMGIPPQEPAWDIPIPDSAYAFARQHLHPNRPNLVISPCSSHPLRNWSARHYAEVADFAIQSLHMQVLLCGGPGEIEQRTGAAIEQQMQSQAVNLIGQDTLKQSLAILKLSDVAITPDSGPAHFASLLGTPVIGLYAATWSIRSGPYYSLELCVDKYPEAAKQYRDQAPEELRWGHKIEQEGVMNLITVNEVKMMLERCLAF